MLENYTNRNRKIHVQSTSPFPRCVSASVCMLQEEARLSVGRGPGMFPPESASGSSACLYTERMMPNRRLKDWQMSCQTQSDISHCCNSYAEEKIAFGCHASPENANVLLNCALKHQTLSVFPQPRASFNVLYVLLFWLSRFLANVKVEFVFFDFDNSNLISSETWKSVISAPTWHHNVDYFTLIWDSIDDVCRNKKYSAWWFTFAFVPGLCLCSQCNDYSLCPVYLQLSYASWSQMLFNSKPF